MLYLELCWGINKLHNNWIGSKVDTVQFRFKLFTFGLIRVGSIWNGLKWVGLFQVWVISVHVKSSVRFDYWSGYFGCTG